MHHPSPTRTIWRRLLAGAALLAALACGGGGGGASAPAPDTSRSWRGPQRLETNLLADSYYPQVAVDDQGRALVVWFRLLSGYGDIWAKVYQPGAGWQPEGTIESLDGDARYPVVAVSGSTFFMAWEHLLPGSVSVIYVSRYIPGSGWDGPLKISTGTTGASMPAVAVDGRGNALVAWTQLNASNFYEVQASRFNAASGYWDVPTLLGASPALDNYNPRVAMDPSGNGVVAWNRTPDITNGPGAICAVSYKAGTGWQIPASIPSLQAGVEGADDAYGCSLAMSSAGAVLGWAESVSATGYRPFARIWKPSSGTWSAAATITNATLEGSSPEVAIDGQGKAYAAWVQNSGGAWNDLCVSSTSTTGAWTAVAQPLDNLSGGIAYLALNVNPSGFGVVTWQQISGPVASIFASNLSPTGEWGASRLLETDDTGPAYAPAVHVSTGGSAMATWYQKDANGIRHIYANSWN